MNDHELTAHTVSKGSTKESIVAVYNGKEYIVRKQANKDRYSFIALRKTSRGDIFFTPHARVDLAVRSYEGCPSEKVVEIVPF